MTNDEMAKGSVYWCEYSTETKTPDDKFTLNVLNQLLKGRSLK